MRKFITMADPAAGLATLLLLGVLGWKIALLCSSPPPFQANRLLAPVPAVRADSGRLVMVADAADGAAARIAAQKVRRAQPGRPLEIRAVAWTTADGRRTPAAGVAALVRAYGHTELPVLLTLSPGGQVVRVQSLAGGTE